MFQTSFNSLRKSKHHVFFGFVSEPPLVQWGVDHHPKGSNQHFFRCIVFPIENGGNSSHSMLVYQTVPELSIVSAQVPLAPHGLTWYASPNCLSGCDLMGADCRNCWWFRNLASKKTVEMGKNEYEHIAHCFSLSFCQRIMMDHVQISIYLLPIKQGMTCYDTLWWK